MKKEKKRKKKIAISLFVRHHRVWGVVKIVLGGITPQQFQTNLKLKKFPDILPILTLYTPHTFIDIYFRKLLLVFLVFLHLLGMRQAGEQGPQIPPVPPLTS